MSEEDLLGRLERLERDKRRLKHVALVAVVLLGPAVALGAAYARPAIRGASQLLEDHRTSLGVID